MMDWRIVRLNLDDRSPIQLPGYQRPNPITRLPMPQSNYPITRLSNYPILRRFMSLSRREFTVSVLGAAAAATRVAIAAPAPAQTGTPASKAPAPSPGTASDALAGLTLAEVSARLRAGAVTSTDRVTACLARVAGKANLHEFAFGGSSATSYYGAVRNPWALERNPGGSSGGSAAAVATDLCYAALGTDTGGSIRTPASYCSVVGLKPTYGLVPIRGIIPLTLSLDHCGPITRSVADAAMPLNVLAGYDRRGIASGEAAHEDYVAAMKPALSR